MTQTFDCIVLGIGGVGSAAVMQLAERGVAVLGLDQFPPAHNRGSSHGHSRAIRQAYFEHPDYVPLLLEAYRLWEQLELWQGSELFHRVGLLEVGPPTGAVVPGVLRSAALHNLDVDQLTEAEARQRFPGFHIPAGSSIVFERNAGYLLVEDCVRAHVARAQQLGAEIHIGSPVIDWSAEHDSVRVRTTTAEYSASRLIITCGAWAARLLQRCRLPLQVLRKHLHWYTSNCEVYGRARGCPVFFFEMENGHDFFYGFPQFDQRGVKVAEHSGGERIADPQHVPRDQDPGDRQRVDQFVTRYLPQLGTQHAEHDICLYTMTPDAHFLLDYCPGTHHVAFAVGLSGHGFKFTPVLGKILSELVLDGETRQLIAFLGLSRLGLGKSR